MEETTGAWAERNYGAWNVLGKKHSTVVPQNNSCDVGKVGRRDWAGCDSGCHGEPCPVSVEPQVMLHIFYSGRFGAWSAIKDLR